MLPDLKEIGKRRRGAGMTQQQLARCAGISQSLVAKIECGAVEPGYGAVRRIFECLDAAARNGGKTAGEIASMKICYVGPHESIGKAVELMKRHGFSQLPVLEKGRVVGSISDGDVVEFLGRGKGAGASVGEVMGEPFARVAKDAPVEAVAGLLRYEKAVIVTKGEEAVGIITRADLFKLF